MRLKIYLSALALTVIAEGLLSAQQLRTKITMSEAEMLVPRFQFKPVKSLDPNTANPLDTVMTSTPGVYMVLYDDNTWKYWRNPEDIALKEIFTDHWTPDVPNPFDTKLSDLPDEIILRLVDENMAYKCPDKRRVYSRFGYRHRRRHQGVDLPLTTGDPVYAMFPGKVRMSKYYAAYGNLVIVRHENGLETFYAHLSKRHVEVGDWVEAGEVIGLGGSTGRSTGAHLHLETRYQGYAFDPQWIVDFETGNLRSSLFVLKKKYLSADSRYVPESIEEELTIYLADTREKAIADSIAAVKKAAAEKAAKEAAAAKYVTVKSGDTLSLIAKRNGTTVSAICKLNPGLTTRTVLKIGRKIRVK